MDSTISPAPAPNRSNQLIHETSPYLLQHAGNPVDWFPWGPEAMEKARREDKLIFLSIGYSTCYWCHVMERESFENEAIARVMNERVVSIKVDREERPDLDEIYMTATQLLTGHGGWPMSVWLEPEKLRPIFAGTYFPPEPRHGLPSFEQVIAGIDDAWRRDRTALLKNAERLANAVRETVARRQAPVLVGAREVSKAVNMLMRSYDREHGGFGNAPKFPQPAYLDLLLAAREFIEEEARKDVDNAVRHTLERMAMGGMYDQVGGGFHRYSTDAKWLVPHFEKMLYDNAQLAPIYARASILFADRYFAQIARETLVYALREMRDPDGGFWSAQDAEVDAREGRNYLWTREELGEALERAGRSDLTELATQSFGLDLGTNFSDPHHPAEKPSNVLFLVERPEALAARFGRSEQEFVRDLAEGKRVLLEHRDCRPQPATDDKVIASWNGLMIAAMAEVGRILNEPLFIESAGRAARFILEKMRGAAGGLLRTWRRGEAKVDGFAEDYAATIRGLLALDRANGGGGPWLDTAIELHETARGLFADPAGGWFDTREGQADLFVRARSIYDGALPSATGVMLHNLLELFQRTGDSQYLEEAVKALHSISAVLHDQPLATAVSAAALIHMVDRYEDQLRQGPPSPQTAIDGVRVKADRAEIRVGAEGSEMLTIEIEVPAGSHINAHEPGDARLFGLLVHMTDGEGVVATAAYPPSENWRDIGVHTGRIQIPVTFEKIGVVTGEPRITVRWQACTESECMQPRETVLPVRLIVEDARNAVRFNG
jgi:uncharacterized protein YyaL (SSP411 family)